LRHRGQDDIKMYLILFHLYNGEV